MSSEQWGQISIGLLLAGAGASVAGWVRLGATIIGFALFCAVVASYTRWRERR